MELSLPTFGAEPDTDSDTAYIGNEPTILEATKQTVESGNYPIPINGLSPESDPKFYTDEEMAKVDNKLANDLIGKICNLARELQCFYWHLDNTGTEKNKKKYLPQIYDDICILAVLSNIAIDSAKRKYDVQPETELKEIRKRPYLKAEGIILNDSGMYVTERRYKKTLSKKQIEEYEEKLKEREKATTQEEIDKITSEIDEILIKEDKHMVRPYFTRGLKSTSKKKERCFENDEEKKLYRQKQILAAQERRQLEEKIYVPLTCTMDMLRDVVGKNLQRASRKEKLLTIVDVLNPIPSGTKADYNRIEAIKKIAIEGNNRLNQLYARYKSRDISGEELYEQKRNIIQNILNDIRYADVNKTVERKITPWDIQKLIRDIYDIHPRKDKHGKYVKGEDGKTIMDDKRDKRLIGDRDKNCVGQRLLQWIYEVYPEEFLEVLRKNTGQVTYLEEVKENESSIKKPINSLKDLKNWTVDEEVFELYGNKYRIKTKNVQ